MVRRTRLLRAKEFLDKVAVRQGAKGEYSLRASYLHCS
jgi:hypothetical protein